MGSWKFLVGGSLALSLLGVLVLAAAWFWRARLYRTLFHPVVTARQSSFFREFPVRAGDVVFLGDSLTSQARWGELFPGVAARNRGISGDTTADVRARLREITSAAPAQIFLMIGTNDLGLGLSEEVVLQNIDAILEEIRIESPRTEVFVQTLLPRSRGYAARIRSVNEGLIALADRRGLRWIDVGGAMSSAEGALRADLTGDELHLLGPGYEIWKTTLAPWVGPSPRPLAGKTLEEQ